MNMIETDLSQLAAAINDPAVTYIGDPFRGTYHVQISTGAHDVSVGDIQAQLNELEIEFKFTTPTLPRGPQARFGFYSVDSLARLLEAVGDDLDESRREKLDVLIRARSPVPDNVLAKMRHGESLYGVEELVRRLNEKRIPDGMGGIRWTIKKVNRALEM